MSTRSPASEESLPNRRTLVDQVKSDQNSEAKLVNNRPEAAVQRKLQAVANNSPRVKQLQALQQLANKSVGVQDPTPIQRQAASNTKSPNQTGLPDTLKSGIENLSGHSMDDVKVHYNSAQPAQLNAHAYAQGTDIHLGPGQEKHLPHEAWHVVQQKQGRVQATRQMKGSVPLNDDAGLEHEADVMGARALQSNAISSPPKSTNTTSSIGKAVQRVQKTLPTAGKLNMIGETHTDYPHIGSRQLESKTLRQMLADGYQYYTEDKLKTSRYDSDYADPMDLRLKQIIGLVHGSATFQLGMLSEMDADQIERANEEANKASMALQSVDVNEVMKMFAPRIASTGFDKDALVEEMGINTQRYSLDELEKLSDWATWEEIQDGYKPDSDDEQDESSGEDFDSNFDEIQAAFADAFRVRSLEAMKSSSSQDMGASSSAMSDGGLGLARRWAMHQFENFINDYKGRFSPTLKQYYSLKKDGEYQWQPHFRFDLALIPPLLAIWERLEGIQEQIHKTQGSSLNEHLPSIIRESRACLADLCQILMQGAPSGFDPADGDSTVLQRSLAMNRAAQANQNVPIIWKVGNKHVEDIHRLEQAGRIPTTGYYYILEKDFRHRYNSGGELAGYSGSNDELGPGYQQAEATWQKEIERADRKLASRFPGEDQLASLEHLDLGNLVTNQTRLIVEAVEQGALPNLQRLTISEVSMTPQLRGRLLAQGIEVVLTQVAPQ